MGLTHERSWPYAETLPGTQPRPGRVCNTPWARSGISRAVSEVAHDPFEGGEKYRAIKELGRGGMGEVFLAEHMALGTRVVIKLLHAELSAKNTLVDRMRIEAQACARLNHPNIVRVTDFDRTPSGRPFFVMEYLPGRSLGDVIAERGGFLPVPEAIDIARQALDGLGAAHAASLVHRDIKLDNLFLCDQTTQSGRPLVKILDFGVAKVMTGAGDDAPAPLMIPTGTGVVVGTPRFFAPEQARGKPLDHRADIYAVGLVLYTLVAGRGPFDEARNITEMAKAHVFKKPEPPSHFAQQPIPDRLDGIVLRAIAKQPEQRFQSAAEFSAMLSRVLDDLAAPSSQAAAPEVPHLAKTAYLPEAHAEVTGSEAPTHRLQPHGGPPQGAAGGGGYPAPPHNGAHAAAPTTALPSGSAGAAGSVGASTSLGAATGNPPRGAPAASAHHVPPTALLSPQHQPLPQTGPLPPPTAPASAGPGGAGPAPGAISPVAVVGPKRYSAGLAAAIVLLAGLVGAAVAAGVIRLL